MKRYLETTRSWQEAMLMTKQNDEIDFHEPEIAEAQTGSWKTEKVSRVANLQGQMRTTPLFKKCKCESKLRKSNYQYASIRWSIIVRSMNRRPFRIPVEALESIVMTFPQVLPKRIRKLQQKLEQKGTVPKQLKFNGDITKAVITPVNKILSHNGK